MVATITIIHWTLCKRQVKIQLIKENEPVETPEKAVELQGWAGCVIHCLFYPGWLETYIDGGCCLGLESPYKLFLGTH